MDRRCQANIGLCSYAHMAPPRRYRIAVTISIHLQFDHNPLRVEAVFFAGECFGQIWIAFPVSIKIAVIEARIAIEFRSVVACNTTMRQTEYP